MSFQDWQKNGWLRPHKTSRQEIAGLLAVVERDLETSADPKLDGDWRFAIAYNAALQCASLALKSAGYEAQKGGGAHHQTIESLKLTIGDDGAMVDLLQAFRAKRGGGIYETTGVASDTEIEELRALAKSLRDRVLTWLKQAHPELLPPQSGSASKRDGRKAGASKGQDQGKPRPKSDPS
jgi:hypothetical protein